VDRYLDSFNEHADALREKREAEDFDNLQHTLSGVETGHQSRHGLTNDTNGSVSSGGKRKSVTQQLQETLDWLLLNDPIYRQAYDSAWSALNEAETAAENALEAALLALEDAQENLDGILSRAAQLSDGTRVFKDANGDVWTEHGMRLSEVAAAEIEWRGDEPSREDYLSGQDGVGSAQSTIDEILGIQVEIGGYRNEMTDQDNPPSQDRLDEIRERAREIKVHISKQAPSNTTSQSDEVGYSDNANAANLLSKPNIDFGGKP